MRQDANTSGHHGPARRGPRGALRVVLMWLGLALAWAAAWVAPSLLASLRAAPYVMIHDSTWHTTEGKLVFGSAPPAGAVEQTATVEGRWFSFSPWGESALVAIESKTSWTRAPRFDGEFRAAAMAYQSLFGGSEFLDAHPELYADLLMREGPSFRLFTFSKGLWVLALESALAGALLAWCGSAFPPWIAKRRRARRIGLGQCAECGYPRGAGHAATCPECGAAA